MGAQISVCVPAFSSFGHIYLREELPGHMLVLYFKILLNHELPDTSEGWIKKSPFYSQLLGSSSAEQVSFPGCQNQSSQREEGSALSMGCMHHVHMHLACLKTPRLWALGHWVVFLIIQ